MKITLKKNIEDEKFLTPFIIEVEPEYFKKGKYNFKNNISVVRYLYDTEKISKEILKNISEKFRNSGIENIISEKNLWSNNPEKFSLNINASTYCGAKKNYSLDLILNNLVKTTGTEIKKGIFFDTEYISTIEKPGIQIIGAIWYESSAKNIDPSKVLKILDKDKYEFEVITTTQETEEKYNKILKKYNDLKERVRSLERETEEHEYRDSDLY